MIVLAVDESYQRTGLAVVRDGEEIVRVGDVPLNGWRSRIVKRQKLREALQEWMATYHPEMVIVERVRLFNRGHISLKTIAALSGLVAMICDTVDPLPVYSVDTRQWKRVILGRSNATKTDAVRWAREMTGTKYSHDAADALAMAFVPWARDSRKLLEREEG